MPSTEEPINPIAALHVFAAHLEALSRGGQERLWMSPEARSALKEICRMKPGRMTFTRPLPVPPPAQGIQGTERTEVTNAEPAPSPPLSTIHSPLSPTRSERLAEVARRAEAAPAARALGTLRDIMVFATGNPDAEIMFVGEAPGAQEERLGAPFVGPAGNLLDRVLKAMGLERSAVYISNICKFRPKTDDERQGTRNRKPTLTEMQACLEYVREEIAIIQPRVLIALGATAAEGLLQRRVSVNQARGQWLECQGIPLIVTFHPSYLLHRETDGEEAANAEKRKLWEDMLRVMERLNMPVTEKQRAFFLPKR